MEEGVIARALIHHWPPLSWRDLTIPQLVRIYEVEQQMAEERRSTAPPMRAETGSDTADDDE